MEQLEGSQATLRVDVDEMKDQMGKIFDMVQTLVNNPQPTVNASSSQPWATYDKRGQYFTWSLQWPGRAISPRHAVEGVQLGQPVPTLTTPAIGHTEEEAAKKYKALEERLKAIECFSAFGLDASDMCLVPDVVVPPKFKTPNFEKYNGLQCPKIHLKRFCTKMSAHVTNEKLMMHVFQDSLSGASLDWYMQLERLQGMSQKGGESFKEYAQRWREVAARVQPPLLEKELVDTFMSTLLGLYYEKMIGSISSNFSDLVTIGEHVEEGIKSGKIQGATSAQVGVKKSYGGPPKKKEGETNAVSIGPSTRPPFNLSYLQYPYILPYLLQKGMVEPKPLAPLVPPYPPFYDANAKCEYHAGAPGHNIESCKAFKYKVQELLDRKLISFKEEGPNVKTNPLPGHASFSVNAIEEVEELELLKDVSQIKTPLSVVRESLIGYELFEKLHSSCKDCVMNPASCQGMKESLQKLMDQGFVLIGYSRKDADIVVVESQGPGPFEIPYQRVEVQIPVKKVDPMVFHVPAPFSFKSTKEVPWNYLPIVSIGGEPIANVEPVVDNIARIGGMTRSGRIFTSDQPSKSAANAPVEPLKRKAVEEFGMEVRQSKKMAPQEDVEEFLRIIQKSDYKIIDQLGQTPSKISMLSLLLSSEAHRDTLLKILNEAHVTKDITVDQFNGVVANIATSRYLGFNEDELPSDGCNHNKALHISVKCLDGILSKVLVDTGSSLNVMPKTTLDKLASEGASMRPSSLIVKAFDGSKRTVMGEFDLPVLICQYYYLPITSTLHQKLKFVANDKMIVVLGQEDIMVSHLSSFRYIEADEKAIEKDRFGLGYRPTTKGTLGAAQKKMGTLQEIFRSADFNYEGHVTMLDDEEEDVPNLVRRCAPDEVLCNWKAWEIPEVVFK
ncbi:hypothetical protein TSUD_391830 [Trifolium subterraneum]|uniref:Retrotransposon gag domain-containing protein n=1 Tax=Trifolium subterraneum TaxID=3900 RepID=A0A2Z6MVQ6_TRISU|nr:hypothetical protein TSUD_391830 [Trifolium subterraneum]